jgi:hypothetical protein
MSNQAKLSCHLRVNQVAGLIMAVGLASLNAVIIRVPLIFQLGENLQKIWNFVATVVSDIGGKST